MARRRTHLGVDFSYTYMAGRWCMRVAWPDRTFLDVEIFEEMARIAERGLRKAAGSRGDFMLGTPPRCRWI